MRRSIFSPTRAGLHLLVHLMVWHLLWHVGWTTPGWAQDEITFTAAVDRTTISTGDTVQLQLTLAGAVSAAAQPQLSGLLDFVVVNSSQSSQFQIINGVTSAQILFSYQLRPTQTGPLTIPAIAIDVDGQRLETEPITVEVVQGAVASPTPPAAGGGSAAVQAGRTANNDLLVEAIVDNPTPFVGEPLRYRFRLYQAIQLLRQPQLDLPEFTGFLRNELSPAIQLEEERDGRFYRVTEVQQMLFPIQGGTQRIDRATLTLPGDLFSRGVALATEPIAVTVQPLPPNPPAGFTGAVGSFTIAAWVEPDAGQVNEALTLFVRITGTGHPDLVPDPTAGFKATGRAAGWRVYDPTVTINPVADAGDGSLPTVTKEFVRPLLPTRAGSLTVPPFTLTFFEPQSSDAQSSNSQSSRGAYRQISTDALTVTVGGGAVDPDGAALDGVAAAERSAVAERRALTALATDIHHIKSAPATLAGGRLQLLTAPLYWAGWLVPVLLPATVLLWERRQRFRRQNAAKLRAARAWRRAQRRLRQADGAADQEDAQRYRTVAHVLHGYLADRLGVATGATRTEMSVALQRALVDEALVTRLLTVLDWADAGRFAPGAVDQPVAALISEAEQVLRSIEDALAAGDRQ